MVSGSVLGSSKSILGRLDHDQMDAKWGGRWGQRDPFGMETMLEKAVPSAIR